MPKLPCPIDALKYTSKLDWVTPMIHNVMQIGLAEYREAEELSLPALLLMPVNPRMGAYSFGKSEE